MQIEWAKRVEKMEDPAVKAILSITQRTDVISFAGGLPSAKSFPVNELAEAFSSVLMEQGSASLQYGITEGYEPFRAWVAQRLQAQGIKNCTAANVLITNGSQQILDLAARVLINPGDYVAVENPTYLAAVQVFKGAEANFLPVPIDEQGMRVDVLEALIKEHKPKLIYTIPTFHNPTGITMTVERRRKLGELAAKHGIPLIEDNPYGELRYSGKPVPAINGLVDSEYLMYAGTVSKIIAPGLRLGWLVAHEDIIEKMAAAKQAADVLTNSLAQRAVHRYVTTNDLDGHIADIANQYREQRDTMLEAMQEHFPAGVTWTQPDGGMFIWVTLPENIDTSNLLELAIEQEKVAYVPGMPFYADGSGRNSMRINFSNSTPDVIKEGIVRLGAILTREIR